MKEPHLAGALRVGWRAGQTKDKEMGMHATAKDKDKERDEGMQRRLGMDRRRIDGALAAGMDFSYLVERGFVHGGKTGGFLLAWVLNSNLSRVRGGDDGMCSFFSHLLSH